MAESDSANDSKLSPEDRSDIAILLGELPSLKRELSEFDLHLHQGELELKSQQERSVDAKSALNALEQGGAFTREQFQKALTDAHQAELRCSTAQLHLDYLKGRRQTLQHLSDVITFALHLVEIVDPGLIAETQPVRAADSGSTPDHAETIQVAEPSKVELDVEAIIQAQEAERSAIAHKLHNGPAHLLTNLLLRAEIAERLASRDTAKAIEELADFRRALQSSLEDIRDFMASTSPVSLNEVGLYSSLRRYLESWNKHGGLQATFQVEGDERRVAAPTQLALFRIVQDAIAIPEGRDPDQAAVVLCQGKPNEVVVTVETPLLAGYDSKAQALPSAYAAIQRRATIVGCGSQIELKGRTRILRVNVPAAA